MKSIRPSSGISRRWLLSTLAALPILSTPPFRLSARAQAADPLPSWREGRAKRSILDFVAAVTREGSPNFVPALPQRIATFDNDGTLWVEQPMYTQLAFALERVKALAPEHPEWRGKQPFKAVLEGDMQTLAEAGERGLVELIVATHADMTTEEFETTVEAWLTTAHHPRFERPYTDLVYQPMLELLAYLRASGFQTYHRLRRRHRVHATLDRTGLRYSSPTGGGIEHQDEIRNARRQAHAVPPAASELRRRQGGQAGRHQRAHRAAPHRRLRQLGRRPRDAAMGDAGRRSACASG